jgi:hypothetical protein
VKEGIPVDFRQKQQLRAMVENFVEQNLAPFLDD